MTRRWALLMALAASGVATGCTSPASRATALRTLADSVLAGKPQPECTTLASLPGPGRAPFRECRTAAADTAVIVIRDDEGAVVLVSRQWPLAGPGADPAYVSLRQRLVTAFGPGEPACQDPALRGTMWRLPDRHVLLGDMAAGGAYFAAIAGEPMCG